MMYLEEFPDKMTSEQEAELVKVIFGKTSSESQKEAARNSLVLGTMREATVYAKHFGNRGGLSEGEVVSRAYEALTKAVRNFKTNQCRFFAYAKPYVRGAVFHEYRVKTILPKLRQINLDDPESRPECPETGAQVENHRASEQIGSTEMDFEEMHWKLLWEKTEPLLSKLTQKEQSVIADFRAGLNFPEMGAKRGVSRAAMHLRPGHRKASRISGEDEMTPIFKAPSILALDLGTTFGYAHCELGRDPIYRETDITVGSHRLAKDSEIKEWGKQRLTRRLDPRIPRFYEWLNKGLTTYSVDIIVFEDVEFTTYTYQAQLWSAYRTAVWISAHCHGIRTECLNVSSLKKFAGAGGLTKAGMARSAVSGRFQPHPDGLLDTQTNSVLDDNAVDALHLWKWAFQNLRRTPVK